MAVLKNKKGDELLLDCRCGCDNGIRIRIDKDFGTEYCFVTYTNGRFYAEQGDTFWGVLTKK